MMSITGLLPRISGRERAAHRGEAEIREALKKWKDATRFFVCVNDPELMDYAIYDMEAARRKYMFLLRQKVRDDEEAE